MSFYDAIRVGASGAADTFQIERSVRISKDRGNYFSINNSSSGNTQTFTFSFWMKLGKLHNNFLPIYSHYLTGTNRCGIVHTGTSAGSAGFQYQNRQSNSHKALIDPAEKLRDHSAWYHVVFRMDTTNSTQNNRFIIYVNGREIAQDRYIGVVQNSTSVLNSATTHYIGYDGYYGSGDFYLADIHLIDGQALDASYFAETNSTTGQWVPKAYSGSYSGTSYHLKFDDNSSASALGTDSSGLGNNVTPVNFSVATGVNNDSVEDTPTNNFCTLNPLDKASTIALKNGNLQIDSVTNQNYDGVRANFGTKTGKFYWEIKFPTTGYLSAIGIARADGLIKTGSEPTYRIVLGLGSWYNTYNSGGVATYVNTTPSSDYPSVATWSGASNYSNNDIYMIAVDFDTGKIWWGKNNSWFNNSGTANPATGTDPRITFTTGNEWFPYSQEGDSSTSPQAYNFGQQGFAYTPPSGFVALSSENLPDPTILLPNKHFDTLLYTGDGASSKAITGLNFSPDWVWTKRRSGSDNHMVFDSVRGASTARLFPNSGAAEDGNFGSINSFDSNGFTVGANVGTNASGETFVAWNWDAGETDGKTYTVTVVSDSGNKYRFDGFGTSAVTLDLAEGGTYIFNYPSAHPLKFSTTADGTHGGGSEYTTGVTHNSSTQVTIVVPASAPTLYYYCSIHSGMGGQVNTNSTLGSSNFDGGIQSKVKVSTTSGFSIVTYTGNGTAGATVGHGLGVVPRIVIVKRRNSSDDWRINIGPILGSGKDGHSVKWNSTGGEADTNNLFNSTNPTSTVFTIGDSTDLNANTSTYLAYCFSDVASYSKFDKYTGNGTDDGTFVFTGFRPAWLLMKNVSSGSTNFILKTAKIQTNVMLAALQSNRPDAEQSSLSSVDFLSNGFKIRNNGSFTNTSGDSYIYWCFAEAPFKNSRAR